LEPEQQLEQEHSRRIGDDLGLFDISEDHSKEVSK